MKFYNGCGHLLREWLARHTCSMRALSEASGVPKWKISGFTLGVYLTESEISALEATCEAIEVIQRAVRPAKLDCRDGSALRLAVDAFHQGRYADVERFAIQPEQSPTVITY